ncbi:MATE family efflux transporter, partial [Klebsiella oxytoca]
ERVGKGLKSCTILGLLYSFIAIAVVFVAGRQLLLLFLEAGEGAILEDACYYIRRNVIFYFPLAMVNIVRFLIQGMGFSRLAVFA